MASHTAKGSAPKRERERGREGKTEEDQPVPSQVVYVRKQVYMHI